MTRPPARGVARWQRPTTRRCPGSPASMRAFSCSPMPFTTLSWPPGARSTPSRPTPLRCASLARSWSPRALLRSSRPSAAHTPSSMAYHVCHPQASHRRRSAQRPAPLLRVGPRRGRDPPASDGQNGPAHRARGTSPAPSPSLGIRLVGTVRRSAARPSRHLVDMLGCTAQERGRVLPVPRARWGFESSGASRAYHTTIERHAEVACAQHGERAPHGFISRR
jgi:hypothetical protein